MAVYWVSPTTTDSCIKALKMRMEELKTYGIVLPGRECLLKCGSKYGGMDGGREKRMARGVHGATSVVWRRLPATCV